MFNCFIVAAANNAASPCRTVGTAPAIQRPELEELLTKEVYVESSTIPAYSAHRFLSSCSSSSLPLLPFRISFACVSVSEVAQTLVLT